MSRPVDSLPPGYKHVPRLRFTPRDVRLRARRRLREGLTPLSLPRQ